MAKGISQDNVLDNGANLDNKTRWIRSQKMSSFTTKNMYREIEIDLQDFANNVK
jgi:hypothetical protein